MHFNDVFQAHISVYILINNEEWNQIMYQYVRVSAKTLGNTWIAKAYCIVGIIFGNFTLLALFTGTLI